MIIRVKFPETAVLELTYECNQKCIFCSCPWENTEIASFFYEKRKELSIDDWKKALLILEGSGVSRVAFSGGEALLKEGLADLLYYIRSDTELNQDEKIVVISNGAAMNERFLSIFKETGVHLSLSLPGLLTFPYHVGTDANTAENVLHWLTRAKEESVETTVNITVTKRNFHEFYETIANGLIAGADTVLLNRFLVGGRGIKYQAELSLSKEEMIAVLDIAEDVLELSKRIGSVGTEYPLCLIKESRKKFKRLQIGSLCAAAKEFFVLDPSGFIRTCNHSPKRVGYIFDDQIITDLDYWNIFANRSHELPKMCEGCQFVPDCDCGCREAAAIWSGSLSAPDPCFDGVKKCNK